MVYVERGTLGDEPVYFATSLALLKNHVNCYFPSELSCQMASNAFSNRVFGHIEKPLLLLSNVNILCGNCF